MKLILKQNVENLGKIGDVVEVKPGYARNFLVPRGLAAAVTPGISQEIEARKRKENRMQEERDKELRSLAEQLASASITLTAKINPEGRLFGSVGAKEVAAALNADGFTKITADMIEIAEAIKEPGVYELKAKLSPEISATCRIWIVPE
jgi:large subunit ribosomal protein L9